MNDCMIQDSLTDIISVNKKTFYFIWQVEI